MAFPRRWDIWADLDLDAPCGLAGSRLDSRTGGGEVRFSRVGGTAKCLSAGGAIRAASLGGESRFETAGGEIEVRTAGAPVRAECSGGSIAVASARGMRCGTAAGATKLRSVEGALRASIAFGNVFAALPSGARLEDSSLNTGSRDIVVLLPSNLAVTIRAQNQSMGAGRIVSEFPEIRVAGMPLAGSRPAVAQGSLNGGGPLLRLTASGGVIYLRRQK